jgi:hypothetical protein
MSLDLKKPITIHFNRFWPGFLEGTNPNTVHIFIELFKRVFNTEVQIEYDYTKADVLCECAAYSLQHTLIYNKKWLYSFLVTGESVERSGGVCPYFNDFSCFLSGLAPNKDLKRVKFPLFTSYLFCNPGKWMTPVQTIPERLVCTVIGNPHGAVRNKFLDALEQRMYVAYGGSFRNNIGYCVGGDHNSDELIQFIRQHKFVITMENSEEDYYITEKVCNGLFAGVVPVYWGSPNIKEYFNEKRFIHLKDDSDEEIARVINSMLNISDEEYLNMINSDILVNNNQIEIIVKEIQNVLFN